jgi:hypothetical protein
MSRTGVEAKLPWSEVPLSVRRATEEVLGATVQRAMRVWGGYTPTPTYRLRLTDSRRAFFKAISPTSNDFARAAHTREEHVYRTTSDLIAPWAPAFYGAFACDAWQVLLLEDLGPKSAPPWTRALTRYVARAYGDFHRATLGRILPSWLPRTERQTPIGEGLWEWSTDREGLPPIAVLAGRHAAVAARWLEAARPALVDASQRFFSLGPPFALLHRDTRSDNLRWMQGRLRLVDWPHIGMGPVEEDAVAFAQSVAVEGGPAPEQVITWYAERCPVRADALDAAVAALAGYFADQAWLPDIPGLPRLRSFQRRQLCITTAWAARRLGLPEPIWLEGIPQ